MLSCFDTILDCDRWTDSIYHAYT